MVTTPSIAYSHSITGGTGPHFQINYASGTTESVSIAALTYYAQSDSTSSDLLKALRTALSSHPSGTITGATTTLHYNGAGRLKLALSSAAAISSIDFLTTQIKPIDLGFATTSGVSSITLTANSFEGLYRIPSLWIPSTSQDHLDTRTQTDRAIVATTSSGVGAVDIYTGHKRSSHSLPEVYAALMRTQYASDSAAVANVPGLTIDDLNASLEGWLSRLHSQCGGSLPLLRWTPNINAQSSYRTVRITNAELYSGIESWIESTNEGIQFHDLAFTLSEVVT